MAAAGEEPMAVDSAADGPCRFRIEDRYLRSGAASIRPPPRRRPPSQLAEAGAEPPRVLLGTEGAALASSQRAPGPVSNPAVCCDSYETAASGYCNSVGRVDQPSHAVLERVRAGGAGRRTLPFRQAMQHSGVADESGVGSTPQTCSCVAAGITCVAGAALVRADCRDEPGEPVAIDLAAPTPSTVLAMRRESHRPERGSPFGVRAVRLGRPPVGRRPPTSGRVGDRPGRTHARTPTRSLRAALARSSDDLAARKPCPPRSPRSRSRTPR